MGNQYSYKHQSTDNRLLRRNMRSAFPHHTKSINNINDSLNIDTQQQLRSQSLEPRAAQEIHCIEHSKSARYSKNKRNNIVPPNELWNPELQSMQYIKLQLENPQKLLSNTCNNRINLDWKDDAETSKMQKLYKQSSISQIKNEELRCKLRKLVLTNNKQSKNFILLNNNLTEQEKIQHSITGLSMHQTQILQKIWSRATENEVMDCTRNILAHLLRSNIRLYKFFNLDELTDKEVLSSITFLRQSSNFAMVFDYVITNMTNLEKVCLALQCLGEQHLHLSYPIKQSYWALFTRVFEDNPPKLVFQNAEGHTVWKKMIGFIVEQMKIGYNRGTQPSLNRSKSQTKLNVITKPNSVNL